MSENTYAVVSQGVLGVFHESLAGTRFIPWNQRKPSRKFWGSVEEALPRWARTAKLIRATNPNEAMAQFAAIKD